MRKLDDEYLVEGLALPVPDAGVELSFADLDSEEAGRDESGFMHRSVLRQGVRTWGFSYGALTEQEYRYIMGLFAGKGVFTFRFRDQTGALTETAAYCAKCSLVLHNRRTGLYKNLKFNIIEC